MVSVDKAVIARLNKVGQKFEILVDPELALQVKQGKEIEADKLLAVQEIFADSGKGTRHQAADLTKAFGATDIKIIAPRIIREGEVQLTSEQRAKMLEERTKAIAAIIAREGINPQTGAPHPQDRVMRAMEQAKVRIDIEKRPEDQADAIMKAIQPIIPIKFEKVQVAIKIPAQYAGRGAGIVRNFGAPSREEWASDGSYMCTVEIAAGLQADLFDKLNNLTHGEVIVKVIKK